MGFKCGIVGLPNVGKSTLFNALTSTKNAEAANFPFCTIDPNIGIVEVPDNRLDALAKLSNSKKKIYTTITFVDIAGLVKGASKGEGLGNKFLSHIREVDAIIHLVRCFESQNIQHVSNKVNPAEDLETIKTEIALSDIETIQKKLEKSKKKLLSQKEIDILEKSLEALNKNYNLNTLEHSSLPFLNQIGLLSFKPKIIVSKVKALLRRLKNEEPTQEKIQIGKLIIDRDKYEVTHMGKSFAMPRKEFELLYLLASKPDKVIKREKIMEIVWGSEVVVGDRTIDVHIRKLREKIGNKYFQTVKGVGYKFINSSK